jgi:hypothetical protein
MTYIIKRPLQDYYSDTLTTPGILFHLPMISTSFSLSTFSLSQGHRGYMVYKFSPQKFVLICTILLIVKEEVQVDLGDVQFEPWSMTFVDPDSFRKF